VFLWGEGDDYCAFWGGLNKKISKMPKKKGFPVPKASLGSLLAGVKS